jgi:hypothetical protein
LSLDIVPNDIGIYSQGIGRIFRRYVFSVDIEYRVLLSEYIFDYLFGYLFIPLDFILYMNIPAVLFLWLFLFKLVGMVFWGWGKGL